MDGSTQSCFNRDVLNEAFKTRLGKATLAGDEASFIEQVHEDCGPGEFPDISDDDMAVGLADFWRYSNNAGTDIKVRIVPATGADGRELKRDRLEIVQPDAPFLVDSVMGELSAQGLRVRAMFHPVVDVDALSAGPESLIQVYLEPVGEDRREALVRGVCETLSDVRAAVEDFNAMVALTERATAELAAAAPRRDPQALDEALAFLRWLTADHFVFLGARAYDYPRTPDGGYATDTTLASPEASLGVLRDPERMILRRTSEPAVLTRQLQRQIDLDEPLTVGKANLDSRVHRRAKMDFITLRRYGADGRASGELRIVGLFTAEAYDRPATVVPLIRRKVAAVLARAVRMPGGHNAKRLRNIVENYPRDEIFQATEDELLQTSLGILHLYDRPRVRLFARRDSFDRFISVLMFFPRERYDSDLRARAGERLAEAWGGHVSAWYPFYTEAGLVRVHYVIGVTPGQHAEPDLGKLEHELAEASRTWRDRFDEAVRVRGGIEGRPASDILSRYGGAFHVGYQELFDADETLADLGVIETMMPGEVVRVRASRRPDDAPTCFRFKLYRPETPAPLADVLPILESLGLKAQVEEGFPIRRRLPDDGGEAVTWVHEFELYDPRGAKLVFGEVKTAFEDTVVAVWRGSTENDGFNRLVLELGLPWRQAALIRALARYRGQSGLDPSQALQEEALSEHPGVARLILELFRIKFDPALDMSLEDRAATAEITFDAVVETLQTVQSLDHDRVLRRLALLVRALKRTNFYQTDETGCPKPYISFKVASRELEHLPAPKPFREIFVWAPHVEGVHLRFGPVARGGLRWSDRRDDFRTEVLGLVKAQQVKNAVIVPVGSKGGFYPKALPRGGSNDEIRAAAITAYKTFLCGLLDITDNIAPSGEVIRPPAVISHEPDDPYLVVAADKGTATFSDIANAVSADYGFWLADAFASGGSAGYDHKEMAITARGAWEAVKRHFREMGKDIQSEPFTVVGVGDMSGDVFGNGMLLSEQVRLLAAFDHRDIFIDPDPDPATSFAERKRMFALPRSSWQDYDKTKLSAGGGVHLRSAKTVALSAEARALLGVTAEAPTPAEVMRAILTADAELLYLGGIGTYVKSPGETDAAVGDKANDPVRIDGTELRVKVVGEGANLGLTQAGRICFARIGGRINTDAIDNSAGVDSSDHEVNIKILTGAAEAAGKLDRPARDQLLRSMTDEVAANVLVHNYDQTLALSLMEAAAVDDLDAQGRFMTELESAGKLDRAVEGLPGAGEIAERIAAGRGLTRPELAVVLAYGKLTLFEDVVGSTAPDDPYFEQLLRRYFPEPLGRFEDEMKKHRLRREIVATVLANEIVNMAGPTFAPRLRHSAGCDTGDLVIAFEAARRIFRLDQAWDAVSALDLQAPAAAQTALYLEISRVLRRQTFWLARGAGRSQHTVKGMIDAYRAPADAIRGLGAEALSDFEREAVERRAGRFVQLGAPDALAREVAVLRPLTATSDIADLASAADRPVEAVARLYHQTGAAFGFDRLRAAAGDVSRGEHFERLAVRRLIEDMLTEQCALAQAVIAAAPPSAGDSADSAGEAVQSWIAGREDLARRTLRSVEEVEASGGGWSFAKLTIANAALRELAA